MTKAVTVLSALLLLACGYASAPWERDNPIAPLTPPPFGMESYFAEARQQPNPARVRLGRWLFFDTRLSVDGTVSCATCHRPEFAFSDTSPTPTGVGGQRGRRKTPSIVNLAVRPERMAPSDDDPGQTYFWDGRATSLEQQALMPVENPGEMGLSHPAMITRLSEVRGYAPYFRDAFGTDGVTTERVAAALADYERTRMSGNSPYDRWQYAHEARAVSPQAKRGSEIFFDRGHCSLCHIGSNFTDGHFYNLGVGWNEKTRSFADEGRALVTKTSAHVGAFKTPGLRDVSRHAPYMHDGSLRTLREVVEFYNRGGNPNPTQSQRIRPLGLTTEEVDALVAFLRSLDGEGYRDTPPRSFPQ